MAWGRRCDLGCESWPDDAEYKVCPICSCEAPRFSNLRPLDKKEAAKAKARIEFEVFYEKHCEELGQPVEGPLEAPREDMEPCL